jgi:hypothetical protein
VVAIATGVRATLIVAIIIMDGGPAAAQTVVRPPALAVAARAAGALDEFMEYGAPTPSAAGFAGVEVLARAGERTTVGAVADRVHRMFHGDLGAEWAVGVMVRHHVRARRAGDPMWFGAGGALHRLQLPSGDPLLGDIDVSGPSLRLEFGGTWRSSGRVRLGWMMGWYIGAYVRARYHDLGPWTETRDQPAPPLPRQTGMFSSYLIGIRGELGS